MMIKFKRIFIFFILMFLFSYALCSEEGLPQRIISLGSTITEELYLLGVEEKLVGVTIYCQRPPQAQTKEKIGTIKGVDLEKLIALSPDLVLATSLTDPKTIEKLKTLRIKVVSFSYAKNFAQICDDFLKLAKLVGKGGKAEEIIQQAKFKIQAIRKDTQALPRIKVFVQIGAKPLYTAGLNSFINDFIEFAGGINTALDSRSGIYSREQVIKDNPDVIIIATMGITGEKEKEIWSKYKSISAVKHNRIYIFDSYKLCSPTPVTFVETLQKIAKILGH